MAPTIRTIADEGTLQRYAVDFFGDELIVTQTDTPSVIRRWIGNVLFRHRHSRASHPLLVGVGVQWTRGAYDPPAETLQLCVGKRCIIIQLSHCHRVPRLLRRFLASSKTTYVGFWNPQDAGKLERSRHQLEIGELLDLRKYVTDSRGRSLRRCSFQEVVEICLGHRGVRLDTEISTSDWSVGYLSLAQILQATVDAYVCFMLGVEERLWEV